MRRALHVSLIAALLTAPMLVPFAWSWMRADAQPRAAGRHAGVLVHGVASNPALLPASASVLVDGIAMSAAAAERR
jgi:hypothetical protein